MRKGRLCLSRRPTPGFENPYTLQSAPQLGVRHTRRVAGISRIEPRNWGTGAPAQDEIGISPSVSPKYQWFPFPMAALSRASWTAYLLPDGLSPAMPTATASCAKSRNAG